MEAFVYGVILQWKLDFRNKGVLLTYYVVPLVFFAFMGGIFSSINPEAKSTLIQTMTVFGVTMGAVLGSPAQLVELYGSEIKKAYKVGRIPLWIPAVNNYLSGFVHLFLMSVIIYFAAPIAFGAEVPENPPVYFLALAVFILVCLGVGTLLGLFVRSASRLTMVSQFIFLPSIMLSGIMFPKSMLPEVLATAGKIFPATWGYDLMTSGTMDSRLLMPLLLILAVTLLLSWYRLRQIRME